MSFTVQYTAQHIGRSRSRYWFTALTLLTSLSLLEVHLSQEKRKKEKRKNDGYLLQRAAQIAGRVVQIGTINPFVLFHLSSEGSRQNETINQAISVATYKTILLDALKRSRNDANDVLKVLTLRWTLMHQIDQDWSKTQPCLTALWASLIIIWLQHEKKESNTLEVVMALLRREYLIAYGFPHRGPAL